MIQRIDDASGRLLAFIVRGSFEKKDGLTFFTPDDLPQQLAYMRYKAGHEIQPHVHLDCERRIVTTSEVIHVRSGRVLLDLYEDEHTYHSSLELGAGDFAILVGGGHGFQILEESEIFEVKQGPFMGPNADKKKFYSHRERA